jgi:hypothetical protein
MSSHETQLVWSPICTFLQEKIQLKGKLRLIIAPFARLDALKTLVEICEDTSNLKLVLRWSGKDIISGITDLDIYPYLKEKRIPLYFNPSIHLKLYVFDDSNAFHSSGNVTQKGLGLVTKSNVEIGCMVRLNADDWKHIYDVLQNSYLIDDIMYEKAVEYFQTNYEAPSKIPHLDLQPSHDKEFSILSLPASPSPEHLYTYYESQHVEGEGLVSAYVHDLILYDIRDNLSRHAFDEELKEKFTAHPFIQAIVDLIRREKTARFGLVKEWLQNHCSDKPTPYKWELTKNTQCLYRWLEYFFDEITWDRPNYSMILRWESD